MLLDVMSNLLFLLADKIFDLVRVLHLRLQGLQLRKRSGSPFL